MRKKVVNLINKEMTDEALRAIIIQMLGGVSEDVDGYQTDINRKRIDFSASNGCNEDVYAHNDKIVAILDKEGLIDNASAFFISVWKGSCEIHFTLKDGFLPSSLVRDVKANKDREKPFKNDSTSLELDETDYIMNLTGEGTVGIVLKIIKAITFAEREAMMYRYQVGVTVLYDNLHTELGRKIMGKISEFQAGLALQPNVMIEEDAVLFTYVMNWYWDSSTINEECMRLIKAFIEDLKDFILRWDLERSEVEVKPRNPNQIDYIYKRYFIIKVESQDPLDWLEK